ncbi:MAG TPA: outer membrane lipoprotein-sorting protein [Candidatus Didemnitutus sp.]|jgi:hypothetical protein
MPARSPDSPSPAARRAFVSLLAGACLLPALLVAASARPEPKYVGGSKPDQTEGRTALDDFRHEGVAGDYWLKFELRVMPHHGDERTLVGELWGNRSADGPVTRLRVDTPTGTDLWLLRAGPSASAWKTGADGKPQRVGDGDLLKPIEGTNLNLFDLQMPFLYWNDFAYEGLANIRGRPAYRLILYPPADFAAANPGVAAVRVALDTQFHALVQASILGADGGEKKTITVLDLKRIGDQWMVKAIDLRDMDTRDKTRFSVTEGALSLALPPEIFTPDGFSGTDPMPVSGKIERF